MYFINPDTGFVSQQFGVLERTVDGGQNWDTISAPFSSFMHDISFYDDNIGYAVGGAWFPFGTHYANAIMKTVDGGDTWDSLYANYSNGVFNSIAIIDQQKVVITGDNVNLISNNGGQSFDTLNFTGSIYETVNRVRFLNSQVGHALVRHFIIGVGHINNIYKTNDGAQSWSPVYTDTSSTANNYADFQFFDEDHGMITGSNYGTYLLTTDGGLNWQTMSLPDTNILLSKIEYDVQHGVYASVLRQTQGASNPGLYWSLDQGLSWTPEITNLDSMDYVTDISLTDEGVGYFSTYQRIHKNGQLPTIGIDKKQKKMKTIELFPNPASNNLRLSINAGESPGRVIVMDMLGKPTLSVDLETVNGSNGITNHELKIDDLLPGAHLLMVFGKNGSLIGRRLFQVVR